MNVYESWVLPRLLDLVMRNREIQRYRARIVPQARGRVLEIGIGSGLNLPYYGGAVERLYGLDPSPRLLAMTAERAHGLPYGVELINRGAEEIPLDDRSVDTVVTTFTLCSVSDPRRALGEMRRVLRPGGLLLFAEHGLAPEAAVRRWQWRLTPAWRRIAGGCHLDRAMDALIDEAGFALDELAAGYARGPRPMAYVYSGRGRR